MWPDHCMVCHKCVKPCPVDIDFGDVSMAMRDLLRRMGKKRFNPGTAASMFFLNATNPADHQGGAHGHDRVGFQGSAHGESRVQSCGQARRLRVRPRPPAKRRRREQVAALRQQEDAGWTAEENGPRVARISRIALRAIIRDPSVPTSESEAVFYFPGCGSERLFSQVGLATQAMLRRSA